MLTTVIEPELVQLLKILLLFLRHPCLAFSNPSPPVNFLPFPAGLSSYGFLLSPLLSHPNTEKAQTLFSLSEAHSLKTSGFA